METLERLNATPPEGTYLENFEAAVGLLQWAREKPEYTCRLSDRVDGSFEVQIEGATTSTAIGREGQWIVLDGKDFLALSPAEFDLKYTVAGS